MCMQDLAISRNITWRAIEIQLDPAGTAAFIPANPNRVAVMGADLATGGPVVWRIDRITTAPELSAYFDSFNSRQNPRSIITVFDFPGIFNARLWTTAMPGFANAWEPVLDPGASLEVDRLAKVLREAR